MSSPRDNSKTRFFFAILVPLALTAQPGERFDGRTPDGAIHGSNGHGIPCAKPVSGDFELTAAVRGARPGVGYIRPLH